MITSTTRRIASIGLVSAAATVALAAPATARLVPPPDMAPQHAGQGYNPASGNGGTGGSTAASSSTDWAQIGYGAAGGIALFAAGAAGVVLVRRHQHLPHHA
jgi:hypothetical protein